MTGRNTVFDIRGKSVSFANNANIFVKPQPQKSGLIVPWTTPTNLSGLTFEKARGEAGKLSWNADGISFVRGVTVILR